MLSPQQVAIGQKGGIAKFVKGIQLHMEEFPSHIAVTVDLENAFNLLRRALALEEYLKHETLRPLARLAWAALSPKSPIFGQGMNLGFKSETGGQQGDPPSSLAFCLAVHPYLVEADETLKKSKGFAAGDMDDIVLMGPVEEIDAQYGSRNQISGASVASTKKNSSTSSASGFWCTKHGRCSTHGLDRGMHVDASFDDGQQR